MRSTGWPAATLAGKAPRAASGGVGLLLLWAASLHTARARRAACRLELSIHDTTAFAQVFPRRARREFTRSGGDIGSKFFGGQRTLRISRALAMDARAAGARSRGRLARYRALWPDAQGRDGAGVPQPGAPER